MLELKNITKVYGTASEEVKALKGISIKFRESEFVSILGASGCGKTTLLNILGGLDRYTTGDLIINGKSTKNFKDRDWDAYRNYKVGFVFQSYNLISHQTILSNVELALTIGGISKKERKERAIKALEEVGLKGHIHKKPNQLSGGQMQRVAIARALVNNPDIILADEPTGALDTKTSVQVMEILKKISKDKLIIMVTHNPDLAKEYSSRIIKILDGNITEDSNPRLVEEPQKLETNKIGRTSMSFFTAFRLSLNNLLTKKGRTLLVSFAGSIGIIGIYGIGKSCIYRWICEGRFCKVYDSYIGGNSYLYQVEVNNKKFIVNFEDTGSQERFSCDILVNGLKKKSCILFVFDITNRKSFEEIKNNIYPKLIGLNNNNILNILIGSKLDLKHERNIAYGEAEEFAEEHNLKYFEVSTKTGENMERLCNYIYNKFSKL